MINHLKSICEYYSFKSIPFLQRSKTPYESTNLEKHLPMLSTAFYSRQFVTLTGGSGTGKTSLILYALNQLEPSEFRVCHVELSNPNKKALYKALAVKMGLTPPYNADDIKLQLIHFFSEENEQGKFNCVIIDEAHTLSIPMIDELRSFYDEGANFSLILAGLPPLLSRTLSLSVNEPMKQRINFSIELDAFTPVETMNYIKHQINLSMGQKPVFDDKCYPAIHSITSGIPRRINQLCYRLLVYGYTAKKAIITETEVADVSAASPLIFDGKTYDF
ncbi:MAG: AAA family ATPase [Syntrophorhabdus sp.]|jgi:type II secretory pathway predicted ATPase ExeA|nr:AAA family ATPase [Syntrophorhabdus sp.]